MSGTVFQDSYEEFARVQDSNNRTTDNLEVSEASLKIDFDSEFLPNLIREARFWDHETPGQRLKRIKRVLPFLKPISQMHMSFYPFERIKRITNTVEGIKDCFIFSSPDYLDHIKKHPYFLKVIKWAYASEINRDGRAIEGWKKFCDLVKWNAIKSNTPRPPDPNGFPGFSIAEKWKGCPYFWADLLPWLQATWRQGGTSKTQMTRICHLCASRQLPSANKAERERSVLEHAEKLFMEPTPNKAREEMLFELSYSIGQQTKYLMKAKPAFGAHVSLTNNSSFDAPVKEGGRAHDVAPEFRTWRDTIAKEDQLGLTWFGAPYRTASNLPYWVTMCRNTNAIKVYNHEKPPEAGESSEELDFGFDLCDMLFGEAKEGEEKLLFGDEGRSYADPIYGLDNATGYQLLQWALEKGITSGHIEGCRFYNPNEPLRVVKPPPIRVSCIGEPGFKSRVITIGASWLTILLQPMAHELAAVLENHHSARSGLSRGWQLFEWVKTMSNREPYPDEKDRWYLSSDLKTATDYCRHDFSLAMLKGFLKGVGKGYPFYLFCAELLCSSRTYMQEIEPYFGLPTKRGILMGDPGTKIILFLHNLVAELEAFTRFQLGIKEGHEEAITKFFRTGRRLTSPGWRHFVAAGDDHFAYGPYEYISKITQAHSDNGMFVSWSKNYKSRIGGFYCEEAMLVRGLTQEQLWGVKTPLSRRPYSEHPHVDAMKIRLFSPCSREFEGKDEPNPAVGKARTASGMISWLGGGFEVIKPLASLRWNQRLRAFLPEDPIFRYLPVPLGGISVPGHHLSEEEVKDMITRLSDEHLKLIFHALRPGCHHIPRRVLGSFCTNARARGLETNAIEEQIREILSNPGLCRTKTLEDLRPADMSDTDWGNMKIWDKLKLARPQGLIPISEAVKMIDRPYMFRDMIYPDISRRHGIDPTAKKTAYKALPWKKRIEHYNNSVHEQAKVLPDPSEEEKVALRASLELIIRGVEPVKLPPEVVLVPRSAVEGPELCTLSTKEINKGLEPVL